jgi:hypothetical protein
VNYYMNSPHVRFRVDANVIQESSDSIPPIPQMMAQHLKNRFEEATVSITPLRRMVALLRRAWFVAVPTGPGRAFFVLLVSRKKWDTNEWVIQCEPPLYLRKPPDAFVELPGLCREVHAFLTTTPGISQVRWYFQGFGRWFGVAPNPDELPWG